MKDKTVLITGAARGQGRSHALTLAAEGADVILFDIGHDVPEVAYGLGTSEELRDTAAEIEKLDRRALVVEGDVRKRADLDRAVTEGLDEFGKIDVVCANAGIWLLGNVWEFSDEDWQTIMDINLTGVFNAARAVMPHMMERKSGSMILTASINGIESSAMSAHYGAAKAGVLSLSRTLAVEMAPYNVRVNAVAPGLIDTKMNSWQGALDVIAGHPGGTMELREKAAGYWGALEESLIPPSAISNAVLYLASDESAHVTGTTAVVDAGHLALAGFNPNPINGGFG